MKKIFIHTIKIFDSQILVVIGFNAQQIKKWLNKNGSKSIKGMFTPEISERFARASKFAGFVQLINDDSRRYYILWLKDFKWNNDYLDILNHEVVHLRQYMFADKNIDDEIEFEAYFQESTYRELRIRLSKYCK